MNFFTINKDEKDQIISWSKTGQNGYDWKFEGENFKVYTSSMPTDTLGKSAIPVYRIWMDDKDFYHALTPITQGVRVTAISRWGNQTPDRGFDY